MYIGIIGHTEIDKNISVFKISTINFEFKKGRDHNKN